MNSTLITRRTLGKLVGGVAAAGLPLRGATGGSAQDLMKAVQEKLGGAWPANGADGIKIGDPSATVRGVATTAQATVEVLRAAVKSGANLIITHEPTFFGSRDTVAAPAPAGGRGGAGGINTDDPVYKAKREFIEKNGLIIFRLRDHWQNRKENELVAGLADSLGWGKRPVAGESMLFEISPTTADSAVAHIKKQLGLRGGVRAVGDRKAKVQRVMLYPGQMSIDPMYKYFDKVDLLVAGEVREWECPGYVQDCVTAGQKRAMITLGRVASEDPGMRLCAAWLKTFVKDVPVQWISSGDPFWRAA